MDSEASSYSPLPKRHCFQASQGPGTPDGLQHIQHWQHPHVQQPASLPRSVPLLSHDSQHLCALKHTLQHGTPQQVALVVAYLQQLQRLRYAAVNHTTSAVSVQQPHDHPATSDAPSLMALKVCHQYISCQQQQLASSLSHQNRLDHRRSSFDGFMHQLHHIHTPTQNQETQASSGRDLPHTAAHWQDSARGEASSLPYLPTHVVAAQQALNQPTYREQRQHGCAARIQQPQCPSYALVAAPDGQSTQAPAPHPAAHMLQLQRDTKIQQQLDQARRVRLQQHLIAQQQQRQLMSHDQQARGQGVVVTPSRQVLGFAELVTYWAKGLSLQRCESVHLACHLWAKVQQQVRHPVGTAVVHSALRRLMILCVLHGRCFQACVCTLKSAWPAYSGQGMCIHPYLLHRGMHKWAHECIWLPNF